MCFAMLNVSVSMSVLFVERSPRMKHWLSGATPLTSHRAFLYGMIVVLVAQLCVAVSAESSFTLSTWSLPTLLTMGCGASARRYAETTEQRKEENEAGRSILLQDSRAIAVVDPSQEFFLSRSIFYIKNMLSFENLCFLVPPRKIMQNQYEITSRSHF